MARSPDARLATPAPADDTAPAAASAAVGGAMAAGAGVGHLRKLLSVARGKRRPLIHLQHNPDPDALGSAEALRYLFKRLLGVETVLAYTGRVVRAENRAMLRHLGIRIRPHFNVNYEDHDLLVVVDTHPGSGTCRLPVDRTPDIVVDHHPAVKELEGVAFPYHDPTFGSTSTMVGALLVENGIPFDSRLATALTYGIRTDTMDLSRSSSPQDEYIYREVYGRADKKLLAQIVHARVSQDYFVVLERALRHGRLTDFATTTWLGEIEHSDTVAELADMLLRMDGVRWVMVAGKVGDVICASIRAFRASKKIHAGDVARDISGGFGGGHDVFAALQMPLPTDGTSAGDAYEGLCDRFLAAVKAKRSLERALTVPASAKVQSGVHHGNGSSRNGGPPTNGDA